MTTRIVGVMRLFWNEYSTRKTTPRKSTKPPIHANSFTPRKASQSIGGFGGFEATRGGDAAAAVGNGGGVAAAAHGSGSGAVSVTTGSGGGVTTGATCGCGIGSDDGAAAMLPASSLATRAASRSTDVCK